MVNPLFQLVNDTSTAYLIPNTTGLFPFPDGWTHFDLTPPPNETGYDPLIDYF